MAKIHLKWTNYAKNYVSEGKYLVYKQQADASDINVYNSDPIFETENLDTTEYIDNNCIHNCYYKYCVALYSNGAIRHGKISLLQANHKSKDELPYNWRLSYGTPQYGFYEDFDNDEINYIKSKLGQLNNYVYTITPLVLNSTIYLAIHFNHTEYAEDDLYLRNKLTTSGNSNTNYSSLGFIDNDASRNIATRESADLYGKFVNLVRYVHDVNIFGFNFSGYVPSLHDAHSMVSGQLHPVFGHRLLYNKLGNCDIVTSGHYSYTAVSNAPSEGILVNPYSNGRISNATYIKNVDEILARDKTAGEICLAYNKSAKYYHNVLLFLRQI